MAYNGFKDEILIGISLQKGNLISGDKKELCCGYMWSKGIVKLSTVSLIFYH